ncbi:MAG: DUF6156 family protein [Rhodomicrobium sp.]
MPEANYRYFITYSGVKLPLRLVSPLQAEELDNRNTYFRAGYDDQDRLITVEKLVYGEVELVHRYEYRPDGSLKAARINLDGDTTVLEYPGDGD